MRNGLSGWLTVSFIAFTQCLWRGQSYWNANWGSPPLSDQNLWLLWGFPDDVLGHELWKPDLRGIRECASTFLCVLFILPKENCWLIFQKRKIPVSAQVNNCHFNENVTRVICSNEPQPCNFWPFFSGKLNTVDFPTHLCNFGDTDNGVIHLLHGEERERCLDQNTKTSSAQLPSSNGSYMSLNFA